MGGNGVKHGTAALAGALVFAFASAAFAATFKAEVEGNKVVVYSTSTKDTACYSMVTFSFKTDDGRETRRFVCNTFARAEKNYRFCERGDEKFVDLKIEGPVTANCD
jgi:hypothetical protein